MQWAQLLSFAKENILYGLHVFVQSVHIFEKKDYLCTVVNNHVKHDHIAFCAAILHNG